MRNIFLRLLKWLGPAFTDESTGKFSSTKFWTHVAYTTVTVIMLRMYWNPSDEAMRMAPELLSIYLGVVALHSSYSRYINIKAKKELTEIEQEEVVEEAAPATKKKAK